MDDAIRISELTDIKDFELTSLDEIIISDVNGTDIVTKKTTISSFIDFFTSQDLSFTGSIELQGTIQPPIGKELDFIVNDLDVKGDITLLPTAEVYGLLLTKHLTDVSVDRPLLKDDYSIFWDSKQPDKDGINGAFVAKPGVVDAPEDGKPYIRKDGKWVEFSIDIDGLVDEPPCDHGYYVRRCKNGVHYWEDISNFFFPPQDTIADELREPIRSEDGELMYLDGVSDPVGGIIGPPGPEGPIGPTGATGATGPAPGSTETYYIEFDDKYRP